MARCRDGSRWDRLSRLPIQSVTNSDMASNVHNTQGYIPRDVDDKQFQIRDYQVEMVNKSLEGNLIVVVSKITFVLFSRSKAPGRKKT